MHIYQHLLLHLIILNPLAFLHAAHTAIPQKPRMVVIIVIDQFSAHYIPKLRPFLTGGIGMLAKEGVQFVNASYDHALPATGPGHTMLSTGTYGSIHGIINNRWFDKNGNEVACDDDTPENAAVFNPEGGLFDYGKSARQTLVDNLSDQLMLHSYPHARNTVWSLSLKSRAATAMAGRLGKAVWFNEKTGLFTSSKAYFKQLPQWIKNFNKTLENRLPEYTWKLFHPETSLAYAFENISNYCHSSIHGTALGIARPLKMAKPGSYKNNIDYALYEATPIANKELIDLAIACINTQFINKKNDRFILWLSLSSLDKVGHAFGPESKEALDMIYHMDAQLNVLIDTIYQKIPAEEVLFVFTADHGIQEIPELLQKRGLDLARRYVDTNLIAHINNWIQKKHGIQHIISGFKEPQFYINNHVFNGLSLHTKKAIYRDIKQYLLSLPGVRRAWTFDELSKAPFHEYDTDRYLARQLYKGRSGDIIYSVNPYTMIDIHPKGTSHITSYANNTHVPLIFYQKGRFMNKRVTKNVYIPQVSVSLATLLDVPRPSAATANVLPNIAL